MKKRVLLYIFLTFIIFFGCRKQVYNLHNKLSFSSDTVFFDTVFTNIGSATQILKVYNLSNSDIVLDHVFLAGGENSDFRLNINGLPTTNVQNILISAHDSIYIFVEVTVKDFNKGYLLRTDSIIFVINEQIQTVQLVAVGWEVYLIKGLIIKSDTSWNSDKPVLIWNYVIVDSNATLNINAGTQVFLHRFAGIHVLGSIKVNGLSDCTVVFSSDRLESYYENLPGQWGAIVLYPTSYGNYFKWCVIKNSIIGISIDSVLDTVLIDHSIIYHQSYANIFANNSNINLYTSLLADAGWYNFAAINGGTYKIYSSTIANYYTWGTIRNTPALAITNYHLQGNNPVYVSSANVQIINSIIYGSLDNEIILSPAYQWQNFNYLISFSLLKTDQDYTTTSCIINQDPKFKDIVQFDFSLDENSPAIDKGNIDIINAMPILIYDLNQANRLQDGLPDIGAYEWQLN